MQAAPSGIGRRPLTMAVAPTDPDKAEAFQPVAQSMLGIDVDAHELAVEPRKLV